MTANASFWDMHRRVPRGRFYLPCLLHGADREAPLRAVLLDISASGCRVFSNDRRLLEVDAEQQVGQVYAIELDFYHLDLGGLRGRVVRFHPGPFEPDHERQLGLEFVDLDPELARAIDHAVRQRRVDGGGSGRD
jgi:c-di-GMP-binding flagellar brake protein YcgR